MELNGHPSLRLANTLNPPFPNLDGRALLCRAADTVAASVGLACHDEGTALRGVLGAGWHGPGGGLNDTTMGRSLMEFSDDKTP